MSLDDNLIEDGKNKLAVYCMRCPSKILNSGMGLYSDKKFKLPLIHQKGDGEDADDEEVTGYWEVDNMYTFENLGFSNTVNNMKYLICADCEMGPIGIHDLTTKLCFVAISRVKHSI